MGSDEVQWLVAFTRSAEADIVKIFAFIAERDGWETADALFTRFEQTRNSLRRFPERGRIPPELERIGIQAFREIQLYPYRIIYKIEMPTHAVHIHVVADGRRNFYELLRERLLAPPQ